LSLTHSGASPLFRIRAAFFSGHSRRVSPIAQTPGRSREILICQNPDQKPDLNRGEKEQYMLGTILIVILILALVGALPRWNHSREWGYAPTGGLGLVLLIVLVLLVLGRI
jgi:hypothetical protein